MQWFSWNSACLACKTPWVSFPVPQKTGCGGPRLSVPAHGRWRREEQKFKVILDYILGQTRFLETPSPQRLWTRDLPDFLLPTPHVLIPSEAPQSDPSYLGASLSKASPTLFVLYASHATCSRPDHPFHSATLRLPWKACPPLFPASPNPSIQLSSLIRNHLR